MKMESSFLSSPPLKRSMPNPNPYSSNGSSSKRSKPPPPPLSVPHGHVIFRLLCNVSRIGGVIGKSGAVIKQLQQATSAKIRVEDAPADCSDRVIDIVASSVVKATNFSLFVTSQANGGEKGGVEVEVSAAQEALIRVFEKILEVAVGEDGTGVTLEGTVTIRMLAERSQTGSVIGKGGNVVKKIRKESGCTINIASAESLSCAGPTDDIIEIKGGVLDVKKALISVSRRLQDCSVEKSNTVRSTAIEAVSLPQNSLIDRRADIPHQTSHSMSYPSGRYPLSLEVDRVPTFDSRTTLEEVKFRILCSNDRVGGVIGRGGTIVKALHIETGAYISIGASVSGCDERLITITASENMDSRFSPAQNAVIQVFNRSVEAGMEKGLETGLNGSPIITRLVVPSNQIGCLLGKGGTIITEIRRSTGAGISILGPDQVPKCALENDRIVQISGDFSNVQDALCHVTGRLRENLLPCKTLNDAGTRVESSLVTEISPCRLRDPTSFGALASIDRSYPLDGNLTHSMESHVHSYQLDRPISQKTIAGVSSRSHVYSYQLDQPISQKLWEPETIVGVSSRSIRDDGRGLASFKGGLELGSGSRTVMVTNTTVEIVVPDNVVGSVFGENGSNLARLRQISGAQVTIHEPHPGTRERIVVIRGTPDETQAAQSLLHAFILTGSSGVD